MISITQKYKREYRAWNIVKNACEKKDHRRYKFFGGKGLKFCKEWKNFQQFLSDMGEMPEGCDGIDIASGETEFNKFTTAYSKVKRGAPVIREPHIKRRRLGIKNSINVCFTLASDHYAYIKRQAIQRSQHIGEVITVNQLIREALNTAYPFSGQFDMFGAKLKCSDSKNSNVRT